MNTQYSDKALKIFEERNKQFRIIYNTIINCSGLHGKAVFQLLIKNLMEITSADSVTLTIVEGPDRNYLSQYAINQKDLSIHIDHVTNANLTTLLTSIPYESCKLIAGNDFKNNDEWDFSALRIPSRFINDPNSFIFFLKDNNSLLAYGVLNYLQFEKFKSRDLIETYLGLIGEIAKREGSIYDLEVSNRRFETLIESSPTGFLLIDEKQKIIQINKATEELFGLSREEILHKSCFHFFCKGLQTCPLFKGNPSTKIREVEIINRKGEPIHMIKHASVIEMYGKRYMLETLVDITGLKKAEKALAQNEQRLHDIIMSTADWIWEIDRNGHFTYISEAVERQTGYAVYELQNKHCSCVIDDAYKENFKKDFEFFYKNENPIVDYENHIRTKTGETKTFLKNGVPTFDEKGVLQGFIGVDKDITEKKLAEKSKEEMSKKLLHSTKLAAVGELAAGVAHEVNNPLSIIMGNIEMMKSKLDSVEKLPVNIEKHLSAITTSIDRIKAVIMGMKGLSRIESSPLEIHDANNIIRENYNLINIIYEKEDIHLKMNYSNDKACIKCSKDQIQQVLLNIINNARDALKDKKENKCIEISCKVIGKKVIISISDNGSGIPEESKARIFESFYTTKPAGSGTGLGLSICQSIITDHGGTIDFDSHQGVGTTFYLTLPYCENSEKILSGQIQQSTTVPSIISEKRVLIVDDEEDIREILSDHLELYNAKITTASDGVDAFTKYKNAIFDLILTDIKMPKMTGDEFIRKILGLNRESPKILIITGELSDSKVKDLLTKGQIAWLKKPFTRDSLINEVQKLLGT